MPCTPLVVEIGPNLAQIVLTGLAIIGAALGGHTWAISTALKRTGGKD